MLSIRDIPTDELLNQDNSDWFVAEDVEYAKPRVKHGRVYDPQSRVNEDQWPDGMAVEECGVCGGRKRGVYVDDRNYQQDAYRHETFCVACSGRKSRGDNQPEESWDWEPVRLELYAEHEAVRAAISDSWSDATRASRYCEPVRARIPLVQGNLLREEAWREQNLFSRG